MSFARHNEIAQLLLQMLRGYSYISYQLSRIEAPRLSAGQQIATSFPTLLLGQGSTSSQLLVQDGRSQTPSGFIDLAGLGEFGLANLSAFLQIYRANFLKRIMMSSRRVKALQQMPSGAVHRHKKGLQLMSRRKSSTMMKVVAVRADGRKLSVPLSCSAVCLDD